MGKEEQGAFECLKEKLCEAAALAVPRPGEPVIIVVHQQVEVQVQIFQSVASVLVYKWL